MDHVPLPAAAATRLVRAGWNAASFAYRPVSTATDRFGHTLADHRRWLAPLLDGLPAGGRLLDLGCGCGIPDDAYLAQRFDVLGIDLSDVQVRRARAAVPTARFRRADMTAIDFPHGSWDAVVCLYALIHVPLREQRPLIRRVRRWLRPGGYFLVVTGYAAYQGTEADWLGSGAPMYWSHAEAATYARWFRAAGFRIVHRETVPEEGAAHELFRLRTPTGAARPPARPLSPTMRGRRGTRPRSASRRAARSS